MCCVLTVSLAGSGCGESLTGPDRLPQSSEPAVDVATISGQIYEIGPLYQAIGAAVVEVNEADGSSVRTASNAEGFYQISARRGTITITASKQGYEAKQWQFDLLKDTVLNFSLNPQ